MAAAGWGRQGMQLANVNSVLFESDDWVRNIAGDAHALHHKGVEPGDQGQKPVRGRASIFPRQFGYLVLVSRDQLEQLGPAGRPRPIIVDLHEELPAAPPLLLD